MGVFIIKNTLGQFRNIISADKDAAEVLNNAYGQSLATDWEILKFHWDTEDGEDKRNMFLHLGSILVVDEQSKSIIEPVIDNAELLPIDIDGESWFVVNVCNKLDGALDLSKSKIESFKDGSIKWVREFVFNSEFSKPSLFRISELETALFASDEFRQTVSNAPIKGLKFEECKINNPGLLKSIFKIK